MSFQHPITIRKALRNIEQHQYVLPAIQREFVWQPEQICRLFDSLMRRYPVGSFLFWKVERKNTLEFRFYDFVLNYHQWLHPHCPRYELAGDRDVIAVLDGQQRLTALNIGLRGSLAVKEPRKRRNNLKAYPTRYLYLNLLADAEANEDGITHDFRFLKPEQAGYRSETEYWFRVRDILQFDEMYEMQMHVGSIPELQDNKAATKVAAKRLGLLWQRIFTDKVVNFFLEEDQDLDKVLNIFIRVNSGGTELSYSDLLLSVATAQWDDIDARKVIYGLVDQLSSVRDGFKIKKNFVLKAGLMLSDIPSVTFTVTNFNAQNMQKLQENWDRISAALEITVQLAADFGLSSHSLRAINSLLPLAYFIYHRGHDESFLTAERHRATRAAMKGWLLRSLLKSGVWGSGLDRLLTMLREAIQESTDPGFPTDALNQVMRRRGRTLVFDDGELEDLVDSSYRDRRTLPLLTILFPFVDLRNHYHIDHIFPQSRFTTAQLRAAGINDVAAERFQDQYDRLPNLMLIGDATNTAKGRTMPADWLAQRFAGDDDACDSFCERHLLGTVPKDLEDFGVFYDARRLRLLERLRAALGVPKADDSAQTSEEAHEAQAGQAVAAAPAPTPTPTPTVWDAELIELLDEKWHPLATHLMTAGITAPDDIEGELTSDGLALAQRNIMRWGKHILVDAAEPTVETDGEVLRIQPDTPTEAIVGFLQPEA